jgi:hypothetical protein
MQSNKYVQEINCTEPSLQLVILGYKNDETGEGGGREYKFKRVGVMTAGLNFVDY